MIKGGKTCQAMSWVIACSKKRFGETFCLGRMMLLWSMAALLIKYASSSEVINIIS